MEELRFGLLRLIARAEGEIGMARFAIPLACCSGVFFSRGEKVMDNVRCFVLFFRFFLAFLFFFVFPCITFLHFFFLVLLPYLIDVTSIKGHYSISRLFSPLPATVRVPSFLSRKYSSPCFPSSTRIELQWCHIMRGQSLN